MRSIDVTVVTNGSDIEQVYARGYWRPAARAGPSPPAPRAQAPRLPSDPSPGDAAVSTLLRLSLTGQRSLCLTK